VQQAPDHRKEHTPASSHPAFSAYFYWASGIVHPAPISPGFDIRIPFFYENISKNGS
jgi:hypothetical protein